MNQKESVIPVPVKIKSTYEELMVLTELANNEAYMTVLRRAARRAAEQLRNLAFNMDESDPLFKDRHIEFKNQAIGMQTLINIIENAKREVKKMDNDQ